MPLRSSAITMASPSMNGKVKFVVLGTRWRARNRSPRRAECDRAAHAPGDPASRAMRSALLLLIAANASSAALPIPAMAATSSVPGRRSRSECPPYISGAKAGSLSNVQRAHTLRTVKFVRGNRKQVHAEFVYVDRNFPGSLHGVGVKHDSLFGGDFADLFDGLNRSQSRYSRA